MGKMAELEKLNKMIKDTDSSVQAIKISLDNLVKEVNTLSKLKNQLEQNVRYLKKRSVVAMASEYKKATEDLAKTKNRLTALKNDLKNHDKAYKDNCSFLSSCREAHDKLSKIKDNVIKLNIVKLNTKRKK